MSEDIDRAAALLQNGNPLEAARLCGAVLGREPRHASAAHLLGLALKDSGDWAQGERWLRFSIGLAPERAEFHANLANLLRLQGKPYRAERFYRRALELDPRMATARRALILTLHDMGRFDEAQLECDELISHGQGDPQDWVILGVTLAALDRLAEAEAAYRRALQLNPDHALAHHNLGDILARRHQPEAALAALETARRLGIDGFELAFNRGRAALDANQYELAEQEFDRAVTIQPGNLDAQLNLAKVRFVRADPAFARTLTGAVAADRENVALQLTLGEVLWRAGNLDAAETITRDVLTRKGPDPRVQATLAAILLEAGRLKDAESYALEAVTAVPDDAAAVQTLVSVLLAREFPQDALEFIRAQIAKAPQARVWLAYEAIAARMLGHERHRELFDYENLVRVVDLPAPHGYGSLAQFHQALREYLRGRHTSQNHPLDQSLRNGTQTTRNLVTAPEPLMQHLLESFRAAIDDYRDQLRVESAHPLAVLRRGNAEIIGAWSVRLWRNGFHVNHVHPEGVLSSAYYVDVPAETRDEGLKSGWLKLGEPRYPVPGMAPERFVQPQAGRLVLFPSYLWHGTNAIHGEEPRVCVAFDARTPEV